MLTAQALFSPASLISLAEVRFLLLPQPGFNLLPFGGFIDKLRFSADDADYSNQRRISWQVCGLTSEAITTSSGVTIQADTLASQINLRDFDYLVIFGCRSARKAQIMANDYASILRSATGQGLTLVSVDNASFTLAELGLLQDHDVAVHWRHLAEFTAAYPKLTPRSERLYSIGPKRITCPGGSAAIDLAAAILSRHFDVTWAQKGLADMLVDENREPMHQLRSQDKHIATERHISRAIVLMHKHLASQLTTNHIADLIGISRRQLDRLFMQQLQLSAHQYWDEIRLQHIYWRLVNSHHPLGRLADEVGFTDSSYLCKKIHKRFAKTAKTIRQTPPTNSNER